MARRIPRAPAPHTGPASTLPVRYPDVGRVPDIQALPYGVSVEACERAAVEYTLRVIAEQPALRERPLALAAFRALLTPALRIGEVTPGRWVSRPIPDEVFIASERLYPAVDSERRRAPSLAEQYAHGVPADACNAPF